MLKFGPNRPTPTPTPTPNLNPLILTNPPTNFQALSQSPTSYSSGNNHRLVLCSRLRIHVRLGEPFHLSVTFPLACLLFLPCLALAALRMLTCFLSHSLIWHVCEASPPNESDATEAWCRTLGKCQKSRKKMWVCGCGEGLFLHVIYFKSCSLRCHQLFFLQSEKEAGCILNIAATSSM